MHDRSGPNPLPAQDRPQDAASALRRRRSRILYVEVPRPAIARFRFLLEGYGHLAVATVLDRFRAVVKLRCTRDGEAALRALLAALHVPIIFDPEEAPRRSPTTPPEGFGGLPSQPGHLPGSKDQ